MALGSISKCRVALGSLMNKNGLLKFSAEQTPFFSTHWHEYVPRIAHRNQKHAIYCARLSTAAPVNLLSSGSAEPSSPPSPPSRLSDQEWEMRTGRAIYILTQTLPHFFEAGLVDSVDLQRPVPVASSILNTSSWNGYTGISREDGVGGQDDGSTSVYAPDIRLEYTPPMTLPPPFPRTFWAQGLPLYVASSVFLRRSLQALYTDLSVRLTRVRVDAGHGKEPQRANRDKRLLITLEVLGKSRVGGSRHEWNVNCTYIFSPETALIARHIVDSIEPAPRLGVYGALWALVGGPPADVGRGVASHTNSQQVHRLSEGEKPKLS